MRKHPSKSPADVVAALREGCIGADGEPLYNAEFAHVDVADVREAANLIDRLTAQLAASEAEIAESEARADRLADALMTVRGYHRPPLKEPT